MHFLFHASEFHHPSSCKWDTLLVFHNCLLLLFHEKSLSGQAEKSHHHVRHAFSYIVGIWRYETWQVGFAVGGILGCGANKTAASFAGIFCCCYFFGKGINGILTMRKVLLE